MARKLNTALLDAAADFYALNWYSPDRLHPETGHPQGGKALVLRDLHNMTYKDAHEYLLEVLRDNLGKRQRAKFDDAWAKIAEPRSDKLFEALLRKKLAVDLNGDHIDGLIGTTQVGSRFMGIRQVEVEHPDSTKARRALRSIGMEPGPRVTHAILAPHYWPIYEGEGEERAAGNPHGAADPLPEGTPALPLGADTTVISNAGAIAANDAITALLDGGTAGAVVKGRTGAQPADVDTAATGTVLFTLVCNTTAFGSAADGTGKASATAAAITDDTSADASGTLGYIRASSSNDGATALTDIIDGSAATSGGSWNFNTLSIVAGATVSATSWVFNVPEQ